MSKDSSFHDYILQDLFAGIDGITSKRMFGGWGLYRHGIFFAIISDDKVYFKVGESNQKDYEKFGSKPFSYPMKDGTMSTLVSYWDLPADMLEDKELLEEWIEKSVQESLKAKKHK